MSDLKKKQVFSNARTSSSLKEFWEKQLEYTSCGGDMNYSETKENLGLFFWGRGGKQFAKQYFLMNQGFTFIQIVTDAEFFNDDYENFTKNKLSCHTAWTSRDFLDCVDCLGEDKVKELIKELGCEKYDKD
jgi:hypothetical protein